MARWYVWSVVVSESIKGSSNGTLRAGTGPVPRSKDCGCGEGSGIDHPTEYQEGVRYRGPHDDPTLAVLRDSDVAKVLSDILGRWSSTDSADGSVARRKMFEALFWLTR